MDKKKEKVIFFTIGVLVTLVLCLLGYLLYDKVFNKSTEMPAVNDSSADKTDSNMTQSASGEYFRVKKYDYNINGKIVTVSYNYSYAIDDGKSGYSDKGGYFIYLTVGINDKIIKDTKMVVKYAEFGEDYLKDSIYDKINKTNIHTIKGGDEDYLVLLIEHITIVPTGVDPIILNDDGDLIAIIELVTGTGLRVANNEHYDNWEKYYLTQDALYYLGSSCDDLKFDYANGTIEANEYMVKVNQDKIISTKVNTYSAEGAGQAC